MIGIKRIGGERLRWPGGLSDVDKAPVAHFLNVIVRVSFAMPPEVCFAYYAGAITGVPNIANMALPMPKLWISESPNAMLMNLIPGHHAGSSGHAHWRAGAALAENGALGGKLIYMRRYGDWVACVAHSVCPLLIGEDKNYVWFRHERLGLVREHYPTAILR